jgi:hypothetical protein
VKGPSTLTALTGESLKDFLREGENVTDAEEELQRFLKRLARFFPVIESLDNLERFIASVADWTARKVVVETPSDTERGRPDAALVRAKRWLWNLFWDDVLTYPQDSILSRTMRVVPQIGKAASVPRYPGAGKYDPRLVTIEYDLLRELFLSLLKRPGSPRHKIPLLSGKARALAPLHGKARALALHEMNKRKHIEWATARKKAVDTLLPLSVPWWQEGREFWFDEAGLFTLTPRTAALTVLAKNAGRTPSAVWENVKGGRKMLPQETLQTIETAWKAHQHTPEVCRVLGCAPPSNTPRRQVPSPR